MDGLRDGDEYEQQDYSSRNPYAPPTVPCREEVYYDFWDSPPGLVIKTTGMCIMIPVFIVLAIVLFPLGWIVAGIFGSFMDWFHKEEYDRSLMPWWLYLHIFIPTICTFTFVMLVIASGIDITIAIWIYHWFSG